MHLHGNDQATADKYYFLHLAGYLNTHMPTHLIKKASLDEIIASYHRLRNAEISLKIALALNQVENGWK